MARQFLVLVAALIPALGVLSGGLGVAWAADVTAGLVQVVDTTGWSPAAPGPAGVVYLAARDSLIVVDSDRNNLGEFDDDGINLWGTR
ncbi:MAG: hypothetical protein O6951_05525 [Actinobacteria bacterium]|nr:hypothetical protein [Actinomycetota bacterium]